MLPLALQRINLYKSLGRLHLFGEERVKSAQKRIYEKDIASIGCSNFLITMILV
jgi:hypothetical protein